MALRDHSLDEKIALAAREAFRENGYAGASLRKIAERAGVTVGAIQIRYPSKDALFASLLKPLLDDVEATFQNVRADYYADAGGNFLAQLKASMQRESAAILRLLFDHYEEAVLLFDRSAGSSLEHFFDEIVKSKIAESVAFFRSANGCGMDEKLLGFLISAQFDSYRQIILEVSDRKSAEEYMNALMCYHFAGWAALFDAANPTSGGCAR